MNGPGLFFFSFLYDEGKSKRFALNCIYTLQQVNYATATSP
jgi:hypothetical protein